MKKFHRKRVDFRVVCRPSFLNHSHHVRQLVLICYCGCQSPEDKALASMEVWFILFVIISISKRTYFALFQADARSHAANLVPVDVDEQYSGHHHDVNNRRRTYPETGGRRTQYVDRFIRCTRRFRDLESCEVKVKEV